MPANMTSQQLRAAGVILPHVTTYHGPTKAARAERGTGTHAEKKRVALEESCRKPIVLHLPYPPSVNHLYCTVDGRRVLSADGRRYKEAVGALAMEAGCKPFAGKVTTRLDLWRRLQHIDLGNTKVLWDALEGFAYHNDRQIWRQTEEKHEHNHVEDFAVVTVEPYREAR